jgi:uncharacterized membrane protein (UPF0182 family)
MKHKLKENSYSSVFNTTLCTQIEIYIHIFIEVKIFALSMFSKHQVSPYIHILEDI